MSISKISIVESYIEAYNAFDIEGMLKDIGEDIRFENYTGGIMNLDLKGKDKFKQQASKAAQLFRERRQQVDSVLAKANTVLVQITYSGILAQDLENGLKKGDELSLSGSSVYTFSADKIIKIQDYS